MRLDKEQKIKRLGALEQSLDDLDLRDALQLLRMAYDDLLSEVKPLDRAAPASSATT